MTSRDTRLGRLELVYARREPAREGRTVDVSHLTLEEQFELDQLLAMLQEAGGWWLPPDEQRRLDDLMSRARFIG